MTLQRRSKLERAHLAVSIKNGNTQLNRLTNVQLSRLLGISPQFLGKVAKEERTQAAVRDLVIQIAAE
jgi:hypothetical protein